MTEIKSTQLAAEAPGGPKKLRKAEQKVKRTRSAGVTAYLFLFNFLSAVAWAYPLVITVLNLLNVHPSTLVSKPHGPVVQRVLAVLPTFPSPRTYPTLKYARILPRWLWPYLYSAATTHRVVGVPTKWIQSMAVLEVLHSAIGWVRSPLFTTAAQVASRIALVWGIAPRFEIAQNNPIYATMVIAWGITETIRYGFYACNVLGFEPYPLLWLRYTTFYFLYPLGAGSEAFVMFSTLPLSLYPKLEIYWDQWTPEDYFRGFLFLFWWPALGYLYTYMIQQRRKVLGKGGRSSKQKTQ